MHSAAVVPAAAQAAGLLEPDVRTETGVHVEAGVHVETDVRLQGDLRVELDHARMLLREQAESLRMLRLELDRQGRAIELLRQQGSEPSPVLHGIVPVATPPSVPADSNDSALRLQRAVLALRPPSYAFNNNARPVPPSAELFFRIGNATFTPGGWIDFTSYFRATNVGSGLGTSFQSIPFNNTVQGGVSEVRFTAQSSRISLRVDETVKNVKAYGYLEADFNGYLPGNGNVTTNSNSLRMRVYYLNLARGPFELLGGQGWSLMTPTRKALSPFLADLFTTFHLDTCYQAGLPFARQTQLRFVYHPNPSIALGLSAENPEQFSGTAVTFPTLFNNAETDINSSTGSGGANATPNLHPDVVAKATFDRTVHGLYWHAGAAGLLTSARVFTPASVTKLATDTDSREGGAGVANLYLELFKGFRLLALGTWGDGSGRYIGGLGPGFVVLQPGKVTDPFRAALIHAGSGLSGFEWKIDKRSTLSAYASGAYFQRRYGPDPSAKTPTWIGYGFPGSPNTHNRIIEEASFATTTTVWQDGRCGALQVITQSSYVTRSPWSVAANAPKNAHTFMQFMNLRYVLP